MAERCILHADMDAFYAAVEQRDDPSLRGKPVIVGGIGPRGVVSTASYEARAFGVHSAMPTARALVLCPDGVYLRPRMDAYAEASRRVFEIFESFTPEIEPLSLDEAFLDVSRSRALFGDGGTIARAIKEKVREETRLCVSIGVAAVKFVAKVASDLDKPDGLRVVPAGTEADFLAPLPVSRLWGAGQKTAAKLRSFGIDTIGRIQQLGETNLVRLIGETAGRHFAALAVGRDERPVVSDRDAQCVSHECTFGEDLGDPERLAAVLLGQAEGVGRRLRKAGRCGWTVRLKYRFPPFETHTRQVRLESPTQDDLAIFRAGKELLAAACPEPRPMRLIGIGVADLVEEEADRQLLLFDESADKQRKILETLDRIRERFGDDAIGHGLT